MKRFSISALLAMFFVVFGFYTKNVYAFKYNYCFEQAANKYGVNVKLLYAIAKVESDFNPYAINVNANGRSIKEYYPKNKYQAKIVLNYLLRHGYNFDVGIAQINIINIKRWGLDPYALLDPCYNLDVSAKLLRELVDRYGLSWQAVWHYNGRPSYAYKVYHALIWLQNHNSIYATSYQNP
jgi:Transglycosylase SLT domain.